MRTPPQSVAMILAVAVLMLIAPTMTGASLTYVALTDSNTVELFDGDGNFLSSRTLGGPTTVNRIGIAYGDALPSNPGNELVVLRDDLNAVEFYPDPITDPSATLSRIQYNYLQFVGGRIALSIDVRNALPDATYPGDQIVALVSANPNAGINGSDQDSYIHTYGNVGANNTDILRPAGGYRHLDGSTREPLSRLTIGEVSSGLSGFMAAVIGEAAWTEYYHIDDPLGGEDPRPRTDVFDIAGSSTNNYDLLGIKTLPDNSGFRVLLSPSAVNPTQPQYTLQLVVPDNPFGQFTVPSDIIFLQDNPNGQSTFRDFAVIPEPGSLWLLGAGAALMMVRKRR